VQTYPNESDDHHFLRINFIHPDFAIRGAQYAAMAQGETPSGVPKKFGAGETVRFLRTFDPYMPPDWTYKLNLNGALSTLHNKQAQAEGTSFIVTLTATDTAALAPGLYRYDERVSNAGGEVYRVGEGVLEVMLDLSSAAAGATQSHAERMLALIEAQIEGRLPDDLQSYQIAGRAIVKIPIADLLQMRGKYAAMVQRKKHPERIGEPVELVFTEEQRQTDYPATWVDVTGINR
jgi:hypothetical protein